MRRRRNAWTKICGRRNADEDLRDEEMRDEDRSWNRRGVPGGGGLVILNDVDSSEIQEFSGCHFN